LRIECKDAKVYTDGRFESLGDFAAEVLPDALAFDSSVSEIPKNCYILPGLADVHVHLREPGFSYKETIHSGTLAAARGGYTAVRAMPNLSPAPDCAENIKIQLELIAKTAVIDVIPYGCITKGGLGRGELCDFEELSRYTKIFSDDGKGVQSRELMEEAMRRVKAVGGLIAAHCEDESLLRGGYIHAGRYAAAHGHAGISSESEFAQLARDIELAAKTGCDYHVCHISCKESVGIIRQAKADKLPVTCETAPHYLLLSEDDLQEDGRFKMNPPLRAAEDREALLNGIADGTIDIIATDHAPHGAEEKSRGLKDSAFGIVGLETALPLIYTRLVLTGVITMERLVELMSVTPRKRFGITGEPGLVVFDPNAEYIIDPEDFLGKGRATPFAGAAVRGKTLKTIKSTPKYPSARS